jgi:hypothetical protein
MTDQSAIMPVQPIEHLILVIRGQRVMLDADLAALYGVSTKRLNEQVKRNLDRFPEDFMFQLNSQEVRNLKSQIATSRSHGGRRKLPYAFTEHGAIMAANVLNSPRAVQASVWVVRAFVKLRETMFTHKELVRKLAELERRLDYHDDDIRVLMEAIKQLMTPAKPSERLRIGFKPKKNEC